MCQKYVPMCLQLVKRQIHRLFFFSPSTSHIAYFLKPSVKCIIDCYVFKNSTFYNHSSRYLGVDVALSVMPMQDWDTESMGISADSLGRHLVLPYPVWGRAAGGKSWLRGHGRKGSLALKAILAAEQASAASSSPLLGRWGTISHISSQVYVPTSNSPEALEAGTADTKEKHPMQNDFFPRGKKKAESTFLYSCQKSILTFLQNILTYQFTNPVRLSLPDKVSLNRQSVRYHLLHSQ